MFYPFSTIWASSSRQTIRVVFFFFLIFSFIQGVRNSGSFHSGGGISRINTDYTRPLPPPRPVSRNTCVTSSAGGQRDWTPRFLIRLPAPFLVPRTPTPEYFSGFDIYLFIIIVFFSLPPCLCACSCWVARKLVGELNVNYYHFWWRESVVTLISPPLSIFSSSIQQWMERRRLLAGNRNCLCVFLCPAFN